MRRFSLYRRGKFFYVRYWDEKTKTYTSGRSTRETDEHAAIATAVYWDRYGFSDGTSVRDSIDIHAIVEAARTAPLGKSHVNDIVQILKDRGFLVSATIHDNGPSSELLSDFLKRIWNYDESPYVAEKKAYGQSIGRRHCLDSLGRVKHWERFFAETRVGDVTREKVREFQMALSKQVLAAKTINAIIDVGAVPLRWLHGKGEISSDPTKGLPRFSGKSKERGILTSDEIKRLFEVRWYDDRSRIASLVAATCGLRAGEVLALRSGDIDKDRLHVRHSWCRTGQLKETKTGETRDVPLLPEVRSELLRLCEENPHGAGPGSFIFYGESPDAPMSENILRRGLERALCEMTVPSRENMTAQERKKHKVAQQDALLQFRERGVCFHSWRHGYATALASSLELRQVQLATGHRTAAMAEHYSNHTREEDFSHTARTADEVFRKIIPFEVSRSDR